MKHVPRRPRNIQLVRALRLMTMLRTCRFTLDELSNELDVSPRTVRRDLSALEEAHLPLQSVEGEDEQVRYRLAAQ